MTHGEETGLGVVELLVALVLSSSLIALVMTTFGTVVRTETHMSHDSRALASLRVATERLSKEVREAHRLYADTTPTSLHLWVDHNGDGLQQPAERVRWSIEDLGEGMGRLVRSSDATNVAEPIADDILVGASTFQPDHPSPALATSVRVVLVADVDPNAHTAERTVSTEVKLRNVDG